MISVDDFQLEARAWLAANREGAPRDYGAICPPDLVEQGDHPFNVAPGHPARAARGGGDAGGV